MKALYLPVITLIMSQNLPFATGQGTVAPVQVKDLNTTGSSSISGLGLMSSTMLGFTAKGNNGRFGAYYTDGTSVYTASFDGNHVRPANGGIYWNQLSAGSGLMYHALGSAVSPTVSTSALASVYMTGYTELGGRVIFPYNGDLYAVGTAANSLVMLKDLNAAGTPTVHSGIVYFSGSGGSSGNELWRSDGTTNGTSMVKDIFVGTTGSDPLHLTSCKTKFYFSCMDAAGNREPWISDGTTAGTVKLKEIAAKTSIGSDPAEFIYVLSKTFFTADDQLTGREVWMSDGTAAGTTGLKDINTAGASNPHSLTNYKAKLYFFATDSDKNEKLFVSGGTAASTQPVVTLPTGSTGTAVIASGNYLFYVTSTSTTSQLWRYSSATATTTQVIPAVSPNIKPIENTASWATMGTNLYFVANYDSNGSELWKVSNQ